AVSSCFFQAEDGIRGFHVTGVQTCALPISCITGVSGSGKSTLVHQVLLPAIKNYLSKGRRGAKANYQSISGVDKIQGVIELDQRSEERRVGKEGRSGASGRPGSKRI